MRTKSYKMRENLLNIIEDTLKGQIPIPVKRELHYQLTKVEPKELHLVNRDGIIHLELKEPLETNVGTCTYTNQDQHTTIIYLHK